MRMRAVMGMGLACLLVSGWVGAEEKKAGEPAADDPAAELIKKLDDADASVRAAAETKLRDLGEKALPALRKGKVENNEGHVRLRTILVELSVKHTKIDATDANTVQQLAREEALDKRYANAANAYKRAESIWARLREDASDKKQNDQEKEFDEKKDRCEKWKNKAENLAKGQGHKVSHWGPIPTVKKVEDDGDW